MNETAEQAINLLQFMEGRMEEATALMKTFNGGLIEKDQLLLHLEESLGSKGMDMLALWGIMMANEASRQLEAEFARMTERE